MLSLQDIQNAAGRLRGAVLETPCVESRTLSQITGAQVYLKFENLQFTASFRNAAPSTSWPSSRPRSAHAAWSP